MAHHGWIYYDKYTYQYKLIYDAWYTYHSPMGRGPFAHNCGRSSTVPILQLWNEKFWVLNTALLHIYVYIILRMLRMGWWSIHLDLPREFVSPGRVQEKKRNQLNANFKVATGTCWVHLTCPGWSFWRPMFQARRKLGDRGRSRCMRKHSHPGIVVLDNNLQHDLEDGDGDEPCRPICNPSSGLGRPQGSGHRAGFESVIKAFWVVLAMLIIPFATSGHGFCCTRSHRDWCCKNISLLFEGELLFAPRADVEGEGVEDVRVEVLLLHQLVHDVGHRGWRNPLPVIWIML